MDRLLSPITGFLAIEAAGGIVLLACAVLAILWANSPWSDSYASLWETRVVAGFGDLTIAKPLLLWVNDGLMAVFFFVVGLEIKRELLAGELSSARKAAVPVAAAMGGMLCPAVIYALVNLGGEGLHGWAIPAATDIAFALGVMALVGSRVPTGLKVFIMATAIVDDIGAVLIIALFYTAEMSLGALAAAAGFVFLLAVANRLHVRHSLVYLVLGLALWVAVLKSGLHATIAGVIVAFAIPARMRIDAAHFLQFSRNVLSDFQESAARGGILQEPHRQVLAQSLENGARDVQTPLNRLEQALHPWVAFFIMPVFALANAGVVLGDGWWQSLTSPISLGAIAGLWIGKQVGLMGATWLAIRAGWGELPEGTSWRHLYAGSWLAGIGFTMSLFIASLGFGAGAMLESAKMGVLAASVVAGVVGYLLLRRATANPAPA